jgi:hypothetical protein
MEQKKSLFILLTTENSILKHGNQKIINYG